MAKGKKRSGKKSKVEFAKLGQESGPRAKRAKPPPRPNLFRGHPLPLLALSSAEFQDFVYSTLSEIGLNHGFRVSAGRQPSSDGGFDVTAVRTVDGATVCIQCKRLSSPLYLGAVGIELAKVGLRSAIEGSLVKEHYFISTGEVNEKVRSALRESARSTLVREAAAAAFSHPDLSALRTICQEKGIDSAAAVSQYVSGLENVRILSGRDFDQELGRVWSRLSDLLPRFFSIDVVLKEFPRPDFEFSVYLKRLEMDGSKYVDLEAYRGDLPPNISRFSYSDPLSNFRVTQRLKGNSIDPLNLSDIISQAPEGWCTVLSAPGGGGKSTALLKVAQGVAEEPNGSTSMRLPILLRLSQYDGSLDNLIQRSLGITRGHWLSIPGDFLLLCDGIDEVVPGCAQTLLEELSDLLQKGRVAAVITVRDEGLRLPVSSNRILDCWRIVPLSQRKCFEAAQLILLEPTLSRFLDEFRRRLPELSYGMLTLPFGFTSAIRSFLDRGTLPQRAETLINDVFERRLTRNRARGRLLGETMLSVPDPTLWRIAELVSFEIRVVRQRASIGLEAAQQVIGKTLERLRQENAFGSAAILDIDLFRLALHYEILTKDPEGLLYAGHDIVSDFLAGKELAKQWRCHINHLKSALAQDVWVYASAHVSEVERREYLETVLLADVVLGARCANVMGEPYLSHVEAHILACDDEKSKVHFGRAATAMAKIRTPACIARLHVRSRDSDLNRKYHAERALAMIGDRRVLKQILDENEPAAASGLKVSGGTFDLWNYAPPPVRIELAREAVRSAARNGNDTVVISLRTISAFGDHSDFELVEKILMSSSNLPTFYAAAECLYQIDPIRAEKSLKEMQELKGPATGLFAMEVLSAHGSDLDTADLFGEFIEIREATVEQLSMLKRVVQLLGKYPLPKRGDEILRVAYEKANEVQRSNIWQIATLHRLASFDALAWTVLSDTSCNEVGYAANFGCRRFTSESRAGDFAKLCEERLLDLEERIRERAWDVQRLLDALILLGRREFVSDFVERAFRKYIPPYLRTVRKWDMKLHSNPTSLGTLSDEDCFRFFCELDLAGLLVHAASVKDLLSHEVVQLILSLDLQMADEEILKAFVEVASCLDSAELDSALLAMRDPFERVMTLGRIVELGTTDARLHMLISDLPKVLHWHLCYSAVESLLKAYWCEKLAETLVEGVAQMEWPPGIGAQLFHEVEVTAAALFDSDLAKKIIAPSLSTNLDRTSRDVLQCWYDVAMTRR